MDLSHLDAPVGVGPSDPYDRDLVRASARRRRRHRRVAVGAPLAALVALAVGVPLAVAGTGGSAAAQRVSPESAAPAPAAPRGIDGEQFGAATLPDGTGAARSYVDELVSLRPFTGAADVGTVLLPTTWAIADQTLPSDHRDLIAYDVPNPTARLEIVSSGCIECVTDAGRQTHGDLRAALPVGTTTSFAIGASAIGFAERPWLGYAVNGVVVLDRDSAGRVEGYTLFRVALPAGDRALATKILNSARGG